MAKYTLVDTFNDRQISAHRTLEAAAAAELRHNRRVKRNNGASSYIPTTILLNGQPLDDRYALDIARDDAAVAS